MDELEDDCAGDKFCASELTTTLVDFDIATPYGGDTQGIFRSSSQEFYRNPGTLCHPTCYCDRIEKTQNDQISCSLMPFEKLQYG